MKYVPLLLISLFFAGCSSLPDSVLKETVAVEDPHEAWQQRLGHLSELDNWQLQGRVALRSETESWVLKVDWMQKSEKVYQIMLSGPFSSMLQLSSNGQRVELNDGEQVYFAPDAESLLLQHTGIRMPVNGLRYWMLGLPQPEKQLKHLKLDAAGRLASLEQNDWQVDIQNYQQVGGRVLPARLLINNHQLKVKFIIDQWIL